MKGVIVGNGEIGSALHKILSAKYDTDTFDPKIDKDLPQGKFEIMHICFPYSKDFVRYAQYYINTFSPKYTVVHSSVLVGTCVKLKGSIVLHSPVRGVHPDLEKGILTYTKYISCEVTDTNCIDKISEYFQEAGVTVRFLYQTKATELMKLLALCRYGVNIAFAKEQKEICDKFGVKYETVVNDFESSRTEALHRLGQGHLSQPILYPFDKFIGGHCTVEDMELMLMQVEKPLLRQAYKIGRNTKIWDNCNIYKTAKIGKGCSIGYGCEIGNNVVIGNNVRVGAHCFIPEGVTIEDDCFIAPKVSFSNDKHPPSKSKEWGKVKVKKGAVIGMGSIILPNVVIGEKAMIGAGSIVTKSVPAGDIWYGVAAYPHKQETVKGEWDV